MHRAVQTKDVDVAVPRCDSEELLLPVRQPSIEVAATVNALQSERILQLV